MSTQNTNETTTITNLLVNGVLSVQKKITRIFRNKKVITQTITLSPKKAPVGMLPLADALDNVLANPIRSTAQILSGMRHRHLRPRHIHIQEEEPVVELNPVLELDRKAYEFAPVPQFEAPRLQPQLVLRPSIKGPEPILDSIDELLLAVLSLGIHMMSRNKSQRISSAMSLLFLAADFLDQFEMNGPEQANQPEFINPNYLNALMPAPRPAPQMNPQQFFAVNNQRPAPRPAPVPAKLTNAQRLDKVGFPNDLIPEEFACELMATIMDNPVRLKDTNQVCDGLSILNALQHKQENPFNRQPMVMSDAKPELELRDQINQYVDQVVDGVNQMGQQSLSQDDYKSIHESAMSAIGRTQSRPPGGP